MISRQSIEVFVKYDGNSDAFARVATPEEQALLSEDAIRKIESMVLHLSLTQTGAASDSYSAETTNLISPRNIEPAGLILLTKFVASR